MSELKIPSLLVDTEWLYENLEADNLVIFDGSWHMPAAARDGEQEWHEQRVPGARYFDFDRKICAPQSDLPHMMPDANLFTRELQSLGLNADSCVVVYDSLGLFSSARVWWMLRAMGHLNCAILDGGLPAWVAAGYPLETGEPIASWAQGNFIASPDMDQIADAQSVLQAIDNAGTCIVDARPQARFSGAVEEPRAGLRRGHMPGALNLPFSELFDQGLMKSIPEIRSILSPLIASNNRVICSCGSGVTACIVAFAARYAGFENLAVYDGSWSEWGLPGDLPVVTD